MGTGKDSTREEVMNKRALFGMTLVVLAVSLAISACGGGNAAPPPPPPLPTITSVSPNTAVAGGAAFMLTVTGTSFVAASMVNFGGTAHAPTFVSATQLTATIPASAIVSDGTVAVTVTNPAPGGTSNAVDFTIANSQSPPPTGVTVTPSGAMVQPGGVQQFTATVSPSGASQAVIWGVSGSGCTGASCGMIDPAGKYTAPATIANPLTVMVAATSVADASKSAFATVTIEIDSSNNGVLAGQYAFLFSGFNSAGPMSVVGSFTADGNGNLIAGNVDVVIVGGTRTNQGLTQGTYSVGSDNLGRMRLNTAVNSPTDNFSFSFSFTLDSFSSSGGVAAGGRLIESDSTDQTGTGFFVKQDPAAFSTTALSGGFAFGLAGPQGIDENVALGRFTASGGSLSAGHVDLIGFGGGGLQPDQPFTGTYSVDGSGRGEAMLNISGQLNPLGLILYIVSSAEALWLDTGESGATGMALQQSGGPFNTSSLNGTAVFGAAGFTVAGNDVTVGEVQFDGTGNLSGTNDENYFGLSFPNEPITGTYTVDSNGLGRGAINEVKGPGLSVFYLVSPDRGFILSGNDSLEFGTFEPQTGGPFSNASVSGNYALGTLPLLSSSGTSFASGLLSADGVGNLSGTLATKAGTQVFAGTYSVAANGRTMISITPTSGSPSNLVFYFVSASKAVGVQVMDFGPANAAVNVIEK
jgi:IPT/TIG domain